MFEQLLCHLIGDYWLQNDWMALNKKKKFWIALVHSIVYTLPFVFVCKNLISLLIICITHAIIDGTNIVPWLNKWKNWNYKGDGSYYSTLINKRYPYLTYGGTQKIDACYNVVLQNTIVPYIHIEQEPGGILGFCPSRPTWLCWMLCIVQDNTLHLLCNYFAIKYCFM